MKPEREGWVSSSATWLGVRSFCSPLSRHITRAPPPPGRTAQAPRTICLGARATWRKGSQSHPNAPARQPVGSVTQGRGVHLPSKCRRSNKLGRSWGEAPNPTPCPAPSLAPEPRAATAAGTRGGVSWEPLGALTCCRKRLRSPGRPRAGLSWSARTEAAGRPCVLLAGRRTCCGAGRTRAPPSRAGETPPPSLARRASGCPGPGSKAGPQGRRPASRDVLRQDRRGCSAPT